MTSNSTKSAKQSLLGEICLYVAFFVLSLVVFSVVFFPERAFLDWALTRTESAFGVEIQAQGAYLVWPLAVKADSAILIFGRDRERLELDNPVFGLNFSALFRGRLGLKLRADTLPGCLDLRVETGPPWKSDDWSAGLEWTGLSLARLPRVSALAGNLQGQTSGRMQAVFDPFSRRAGQGEGVILISDGGLAFSNPMVGELNISGASARADLTWNATEVEVRQAIFSGPGFDGNLVGTAFPKEPLTASVLNLTGEVKLDPDRLGVAMNPTLARILKSSGGFPFAMRGSLGNPAFSLR
ncbi:MAG: type II secretion system protein GspN [Deltaproteobacteria bacterium]|nr:type II secretion system protein GspN [Deltaproteobacteria bacterium]